MKKIRYLMLMSLTISLCSVDGYKNSDLVQSLRNLEKNLENIYVTPKTLHAFLQYKVNKQNSVEIKNIIATIAKKDYDEKELAAIDYDNSLNNTIVSIQDTLGLGDDPAANKEQLQELGFSNFLLNDLD